VGGKESFLCKVVYSDVDPLFEGALFPFLGIIGMRYDMEKFQAEWLIQNYAFHDPEDVSV
jgi:hypothetical protein